MIMELTKKEIKHTKEIYFKYTKKTISDKQAAAMLAKMIELMTALTK